MFINKYAQMVLCISRASKCTDGSEASCKFKNKKSQSNSCIDSLDLQRLSQLSVKIIL